LMISTVTSGSPSSVNVNRVEYRIRSLSVAEVSSARPTAGQASSAAAGRQPRSIPEARRRPRMRARNRPFCGYNEAGRRRVVRPPALLAGKKASADGMPPAQEWQASGWGTPPAATQPMPPGHPGTSGMPPGHPGTSGMPPGHPDTGGGGMPPNAGAMPGKTAPKTLEQLPDGKLALGPFALDAPKDWTAKPTTSSMRAADFVLSTKAGEEAELIIYYFGENGAGSVDDNLDRWLGQFQQADGKPSRQVAKIDKT